MRTSPRSPLARLGRALTTAGALALVLAAPIARALTPAEITSLLFLKQEEKVARDVYQALAAKWGQPAFQRIAQSEQQHMDALDGLIARYGLADTTPAEAGRFTIPELQSLHDELVAAGQSSLPAAFEVGVTIEKADLEDIDAALALTKESALARVFGNLRRGSENHLSAFTRLAATTDPATGMTAATTGTCAMSGRCTEGPCPAGSGSCTSSPCAGRRGAGPADGTCPKASACLRGTTTGTCRVTSKPAAVETPVRNQRGR